MKRECLRGVLIVSLVVFLVNMVCAGSLISTGFSEDNNLSPGHIMNITNESFTDHNSNQGIAPKIMKNSFRALASVPNEVIVAYPDAGYYYIGDDMFLWINTTNPSTCTYSFNSGPQIGMIDNGTEHYGLIYSLVDNMASDEPYVVDFSCDDETGTATNYTYFWINTTELDKYVLRNNFGNWNYNSSELGWSGYGDGITDIYSAWYTKGDEPIHDEIDIFIATNRTALDSHLKKFNSYPIQVIGGKNFYVNFSSEDKYIAWSSGNYFIKNEMYLFKNSTPIDLPDDWEIINAYLAKYPNDLRNGVCGDGKVDIYNMNGQNEECDGNSQSITCGIGIGECKLGKQVRKCNANCTWASYGACNATQPKTEVCYDLKDNDCDGLIDEGCERFTIFSPNKPVYNTTSIILSLNATLYKFSKIEYADTPNLSKFTLLCYNCTNVSKKITFKEGNHTLIAKGTLFNGTSIYNQTKFIVDTILPAISSTNPLSLKYTNGSGFYIKYSEDNCKTLILNINGTNIKTSSCRSGKSIEESFFQNISKYNNKTVNYKFIITDLANHTKESTLTKIKVDTVSPSIKNLNVSVSGLYVIFNMTVMNEDKYSFDEVDYMDNATLKPSWKPLCTSLAKGNICYKKISMIKGAHTIQIMVKDNAGNSNSVTVHAKI